MGEFVEGLVEVGVCYIRILGYDDVKEVVSYSVIVTTSYPRFNEVLSL